MTSEVLADFVTIVALGAVELRGRIPIYRWADGSTILLMQCWAWRVAFALVMVLMLDRVGAYRRANSLLRVRETEQVLQVSAQAFLIALAVSFFSNVLFSRWVLVLCLTLVPLALFIEKSLMYLLVRALHSRGLGIERVLIYGSGGTGRRVFSVLERSPKLGLEPVGFVDDQPLKVGGTVFEMGYERKRSAPYMGRTGDRRVDPAACCGPGHRCDPFDWRAIPFSTPWKRHLRPTRGFLLCPAILCPTGGLTIRISMACCWLRLKDRHEGSRTNCSSDSATWPDRWCLLVLGAPLFLLVAVLIKMDSPGPVWFKQERVGQNGQIFQMFKFRTMTHGSVALRLFAAGLRRSQNHSHRAISAPNQPGRAASTVKCPAGNNVTGRASPGDAFHRAAVLGAAPAEAAGKARTHGLVAVERRPGIPHSRECRVRSLLHPAPQFFHGPGNPVAHVRVRHAWDLKIVEKLVGCSDRLRADCGRSETPYGNSRG